MKTLILFLAASIAIASAADKPKPAPKPPAKPAAKPKKPAAKPQKSIGELAIDEAKKADENRDGKITGTEVSKLKAMYAANPKSWLSVFDGNANRTLDDTEIAAIKWAGSPPPAKPPQGKKPAPKKK